MTFFESWPVVHEVIASIPFTFGYRPSESVVLTCCRVEPRVLTIGASARLDLGVLDGPAADDAFSHVLAALGRTAGDMAVVTVFTAREPGRWVLHLLERLEDHWPFPVHGGCYVVTGERIHGFTRDGFLLGVQDELELRTTQVAMSHPACEFVDSPEQFRVPRTSDGATAGRVAAELERAPQVPDWAEMCRSFVSEVRGGGHTEPEAHARLLRALEHVPFRDAVIAWALRGGAGGAEDLTPVDMLGALDDPPRPDDSFLGELYAALGRLARFAPVGRAAAPLAVAAYLAWYAGDGTRARIMCEQALAENPAYSLATLVMRALSRACPPPWFGSDAA